MTLILLTFLMLAPPSAVHMQDDIIHTLGDAKEALGDVEVLHYENYEAMAVNKLEFIETKVRLTPDEVGNGTKQRFSIWMPSRPIEGNDFILVSRLGILTPDSIMLAHDLLRSM